MYLSGNSTFSSLVLNLNTVSLLHTMSSLKVFHLLIQRTGKLFNLSVFSHLDAKLNLVLSHIMLSRLSVAALWSHAGKGLTSWRLLVMFIAFLLLSHVVSWVRCGT